MFSIDAITFSDGTAFTPGRLTVAIGPNNGGKSRFLSDVADSVATPRKARTSVVHVDYSSPDWGGLLDRVAPPGKLDQNGSSVFDGLSVDLVQGQGGRAAPSTLANLRARAMEGESAAQIELLEICGFRMVAHLKTDTRLRLVDRQLNKNEGPLGPQSVLHSAFEADDAVLAWIDARVHAAFGRHILVDDTEFAESRFRLSPERSAPVERTARREFMSGLPKVEEQGDGIRAFCGVLAAVKTTERPVILIDEPEAFLHPPQAFLIGRAIADMVDEGHQLFVATHSAEVLRGILSRTTAVDVLRLAQSAGEYRATRLESARLKAIADDPVLSSARVLDGLFYQAVVVTESDGDVALYRRILHMIDPSASVHFVNSYSKQTSARIAAPYRDMNVPCAIVVDFDFLRVEHEARQSVEAIGGDWGAVAPIYRELVTAIESGDDPEARVDDIAKMLGELKTDLESVQGRDAARIALDQVRSRLGKAREKAAAWSDLKRHGRTGLDQVGRSAFDRLDAAFRPLGLFVVPGGEREVWLEPDVAYTTGSKSKWTERALTWLAEHGLGEEHPLQRFIYSVHGFCTRS